MVFSCIVGALIGSHKDFFHVGIKQSKHCAAAGCQTSTDRAVLFYNPILDLILCITVFIAIVALIDHRPFNP